MVLSTKMDSACVQMFRAVLVTNGDGIWWQLRCGIWWQLLWILSTFEVQISLTGRSRHGRPFSKDKNSLDEWRCGAVNLFPTLGVLARRVLAIPATSAALERLFSTAGNVMTKKRSRLTCDNMEELVYLHEVWPQVWLQVQERKLVIKMRLEWFFFESIKHITFHVFSG